MYLYIGLLQVKSNCVASLTHVEDLHPMNSNCVLSHFCAQAIFRALFENNPPALDFRALFKNNPLALYFSK
jgi:hypothetical protein